MSSACFSLLMATLRASRTRYFTICAGVSDCHDQKIFISLLHPSLLPPPMRADPAPRLTLRIAELLSVPAAAPREKCGGRNGKLETPWKLLLVITRREG